MKKHHSSWLALLALSAVAANSFAQPVLKPGLWEHKFEVTSQSGRVEAALAQAKQMLAALPPEQRQMIERQMAASGLSIDLENYTAKVCVTEEQAALNQFPEPSDNCTQSITEQSGNLFKIEFSCAGNPPITGEGEMRVINDKQYQGTMTIHTSVAGEDDKMQASQSGTWLATDC